MKTCAYKGKYTARFAGTDQDIMAAQRLRYTCFRGGEGGVGLDQDGFDSLCRHLLVEDALTGDLVCCTRLLLLKDGREIDKTYSAQFYDLSSLRRFPAPMAEVGRFCINPDLNDPDILRIAWAALTRFVDDTGVEMLFGCSSFEGTDAGTHQNSLALLGRKHLAPDCLRPEVKAPDVVEFAANPDFPDPDFRLAMKEMPPLLRTYLLMGGWVSGHAVVDDDLNSLHVFTGLEIKSIPQNRVEMLRADSNQLISTL